MSRRVALILGSVTLLAFALRGWALWSQPLSIDEILALPTATGYMGTGAPGPVMPFHPNLRNVLLWLSTQLVGPSCIGMKGWSLLFGTACVPLLGYLVWRLSRSASAAGIAAFLLAVDPVSIDFSRQAIQEVWTVFFALAATVLVIDALMSPLRSRWMWSFPVAGIALGAGAAAKYYVVPIAIALVVMVAWSCARERRWAMAAYAILAMAGCGGVIFLLTYLPWFGMGHTFGEWVGYQFALWDAMNSHTKELVNHWRFTEPVLWFIQPFIGWVDILFGADGPRLAMAVGNPLVWLLVFPVLGYSLWKHRSRRADGVLQVLFWASFLPLALASRPVWLLSSVIVLPFAFAILALVAVDLMPRVTPRVLVAYLGAVALVSALLYPGTIGAALDTAYLAPLVRHMGDYAAVTHGAFGEPAGVDTSPTP